MLSRSTTLFCLFLLGRQPPRSPLFPYTTLFRSEDAQRPRGAASHHPDGRPEARPGPRGGGSRGDTQAWPEPARDRKSTRLNSSHLVISYAVFCLKKKTKPYNCTATTSPTINYCQ